MDDFHKWRENYVKNVVPLMIWHVWSLAHRKENPIEPWQALDQYVDIYRKTVYCKKSLNPNEVKDLNDPKWNELKRRIISVLENYPQESETQKIEAHCMEFLWPLLKAKIEYDCCLSVEGAKSPYGCWKYDIINECVVLHFENAVRPQSPFDDIQTLARDLSRLLEEAKASNPQLTQVRCGTWLNNLPAFQSLFPHSWPSTKAGGATGLGCGLGTWGQYIDRRGAFHEKNARKFRANGRHPYFSFCCHCGYAEELDHLEGMLVR